MRAYLTDQRIGSVVHVLLDVGLPLFDLEAVRHEDITNAVAIDRDRRCGEG